MPNRPEYLSIWLGLARAGLTTALINTNLSGHSLAHCIKISAAKAIIVEASMLAQIESANLQVNADISIWSHGATTGGEARIDELMETYSDAPLTPQERVALTIDDFVLYVYTSGTTGLSKASKISHSRLLRGMFGFSAAVDARATDRMYLCLPMYHNQGTMIGAGAVLSVGGSCFIRERFSTDAFWSDVIRNECTLFVYIGEICRYLLNAPPGPLDKAHRIRLCVGAGLRPDIFSKFRDRFAIRDVLEFYGSTEGNVALLNLDLYPGSIGRLPRWVAHRFPIKIIAFDYACNFVKRDFSGPWHRMRP